MVDTIKVRADLLRTWPAIGAYLGISPDAARYLGRTAGLPTFKLGPKSTGATREELDRWIAERRDAGLKDRAA